MAERERLNPTAALEGPEGRSTQGSGSAADAVPENPDEQNPDAFWTSLERACYESSTDYFDQSVRARVEKSYAHFNNRHAPGSKYNDKAYEKRSRHFRPKTRAALRKTEAGAAVAFFSTIDVVNVEAEDDGDPRQLLAAEVHNHLLNEHLTRPKHMHWFLTVIGAVQDASVTGVCISAQEWRYRETVRQITELGGVLDMPIQHSISEIVEDRPDVRLVPIENFRWDSAADWRDPVGTSPFLIEIRPYYLADIEAGQKRIEPETGKPMFREDIHLGGLLASMENDTESVRKYREGETVDKYENAARVKRFHTVFVHRIIVNIDGQDWVYETCENQLLSDPTPLEVRFPTGNRPYTIGFSIPEAHTTYPASAVELQAPTQEEINHLANLRTDNVELALNKRYYIRRGQNVDVKSLMKNVPGGAVYMNDTQRDVREVTTQDVTGSSYQEHDRLNTEFDEIAGVFSQSSVMANRKLNETVGGMNLLEGDASEIREFNIRVFSETWMEPVLQQLVDLVALYETDEARLNRVAGAVNATLDDVLDVLTEPVVTRVAVGFNATSPQRRINRLATGLTVLGNIFPDMVMGADRAEISNEVMGALGYKDAARFFPQLRAEGEDPRVQQLLEQVAQLEQQLQSKLAEKQFEWQSRIQIAQMNNETTMAVASIRAQTDAMKHQSAGNIQAYLASLKDRLAQYDAMLKAAESEREQQRLWMEREALSQHVLEAEREYALRLAEFKDRQQQARLASISQGAKDTPGNKDRAGKITRDQFGMIPDSAL